MADEEPVDPKKYLEERCKPQCVKSLYEYEVGRPVEGFPQSDVMLSPTYNVFGNWPEFPWKCVKRVEGDETGHKHCTGQYFDYLSCIDKCVATKLFEKLK